MKDRIFPIVGIAAGVFSIIMSFVAKANNYWSYESDLAYGGDAYTGIQNAAAGSANNVGYLIDLVSVGMFGILFAFGLACIAYFGAKLMATIDTEKLDGASLPGAGFLKARLDIPEPQAPAATEEPPQQN